MAKDPEYIQPQFKWYGGWYKPTSVTDYATVSAKGISNGLSGFPNDGAMFGPDTPLNNDFSSGSKTQTSGIQEAVTYAYNNNVKTKLLKGVFNFSADAPWTYVGTMEFWPIGTGPPKNVSVYSLVVLTNPYPNPAYSHAIEGSGGVFASGDQAKPPSLTQNTGYTIVNVSGITTSVPAPHGTDDQSVGYVFAAENLTSSSIFYNGGVVTDMVIAQPDIGTIDIGGIALWFAWASTVERVAVSPINPQSSNITPSAPSGSLNVTAGIWADGTAGDLCWVNDTFVINQPMGYFLGAHATGGTLTGQGCYIGMYIRRADHPVIVSRFDLQRSVYGVVPDYESGVTIGLYDGEDVSNFTYDFYPGFGGGNSQVRVHVDTFNMEDSSSSTGHRNPLLHWQSNYGPADFSIKQVIASPSSPTLTTNPPVSGTSYQNQNWNSITVYLPAYATTSGTAGSVAVAIGSSSTPSTTFTQFVSGSTSSGSPDTIQIKVPAGYWYEVTTTGVTLATATVVAD